jgi:hypothetical protein
MMSVLLIAGKYGIADNLSDAVNQTQDTLPLPIGHGAQYRPMAVGSYFYLTIKGAGKHEVVKVTDCIGDTLYVVRGQDGTLAQSFPDKSCLKVDWNPAQLCEFVQQCTGNTVLPVAHPGTYCLDCTTCITINAQGQITAVNGAAKC